MRPGDIVGPSDICKYVCLYSRPGYISAKEALEQPNIEVGRLHQANIALVLALTTVEKIIGTPFTWYAFVLTPDKRIGWCETCWLAIL